jgi:L-alanine-DL-glutamate epimerase-like enolase superfamily enzyme
MKIVDVQTTPSLGPANRNWSLLKILTDEGIEGLGEWRGGLSVAGLKQVLVGEDPTNVNKLHQDHLWRMQGTGSGVEIALWDIEGKALGVSMSDLLGGKLRDRVWMYAACHSGAFWTKEEYDRRWAEVRASGELHSVYETAAYVEKARQMVSEGFNAVKFDLDVPNPWKLDVYDRSISRRQHEHIVSTMAALRDAIGPYVDLAIDLHGSFNASDALRICKDVEHLDLLWLEDPIRWERGNVDALAKICMQTETPICTGEIFYGAQMFRELMEKGACDLLEPDIPRSGGAIEMRRIAELAKMYHMSIAPHYMASPVAGMAAVHICATIPNFLALEYHSANIPLWSTMLGIKHPIVDGYIAVPDGPGLGIELDEDEIKKHIPADAPMWS